LQQGDIIDLRRCANCGYRSANPAFFRRERSKASGLKWTFCAACEPYEPTKLEVATYFNAIMMTSAGVIIWRSDIAAWRGSGISSCS
jgi:hypothetical protein